MYMTYVKLIELLRNYDCDKKENNCEDCPLNKFVKVAEWKPICQVLENLKKELLK